MKIILASKSPRRMEMMQWLGVVFESVSPEIDETEFRDSDPVKLTAMLSEEKAKAVANDYKNEEAIIIGSDAVVAFNNQVIEKPKDINDQRRMILLQKGKPATVVTSVCFVNTKTGEKITKIKKTDYVMANVSDEQIEAYLKTSVGLSRAGGYGQQDEKGMFIGTEFDCYPNSIGFPICLVADTLGEMGIEIKIDIKLIVKEKTGHAC